MNASISDLRYRTKEVFNALNRKERVRIFYHGKLKGEIIPAGLKPVLKSSEHPMFGMLKEEKENPLDVVNKMRTLRQEQELRGHPSTGTALRQEQPFDRNSPSTGTGAQGERKKTTAFRTYNKLKHTKTQSHFTRL